MRSASTVHYWMRTCEISSDTETPCEKTCEKALEQDNFSRFFSQVLFHRFFFLQGFFDPVKSALFTGLQNFTPCENTERTQEK